MALDLRLKLQEAETQVKTMSEWDKLCTLATLALRTSFKNPLLQTDAMGDILTGQQMIGDKLKLPPQVQVPEVQALPVPTQTAVRNAQRAKNPKAYTNTLPKDLNLTPMQLVHLAEKEMEKVKVEFRPVLEKLKQAKHNLTVARRNAGLTRKGNPSNEGPGRNQHRDQDQLREVRPELQLSTHGNNGPRRNSYRRRSPEQPINLSKRFHQSTSCQKKERAYWGTVNYWDQITLGPERRKRSPKRSGSFKKKRAPSPRRRTRSPRRRSRSPRREHRQYRQEKSPPRRKVSRSRSRSPRKSSQSPQRREPKDIKGKIKSSKPKITQRTTAPATTVRTVTPEKPSTPQTSSQETQEEDTANRAIQILQEVLDTISSPSSSNSSSSSSSSQSSMETIKIPTIEIQENLEMTDPESELQILLSNQEAKF